MIRNITLIIFTIFFLSGCDTIDTSGLLIINSHPHPDRYQQENMPPSHAPAYGRRAQNRMQKYRYYPDAYVYYSPVRNVYFYLSDNRWRISANLPLTLRVDLGNYVNIDVDSDRPYNEFNKHKKLYKSKRRHKKNNPYGKHYGHDKYDRRDD